MDSLSLYVHMLNAAQMPVDKDGVIHQKLIGLDDKAVPVTLKNNAGDTCTLVMPIKQQTNNADWKSRVVFHPFKENYQRGESVVMEKYRLTMNKRLNLTVVTLVGALIVAAANKESQVSAPPRLLNMIAELPDADARTVNDFKSLVKACTKQGVIWSFIKHNAKDGGVNYRRMCCVTFPLLEEIHKRVDKKALGVTMREKDVVTLTKAFELLFPLCMDAGAYHGRSNSMQAASIHAFMQSMERLGSDINRVIDCFPESESEIRSMAMDMEWADSFLNFETMVSGITIPALPGNEGRTANATAEVAIKEIPPWEEATAEPTFAAPLADRRTAARTGSAYGAQPERGRERSREADTSTAGEGNAFARMLSTERASNLSRSDDRGGYTNRDGRFDSGRGNYAYGNTSSRGGYRR